MTALSIILFVTGLVLVTVGADTLVRGAARLAASLGAPPLIIGLTIVAFGTSAPEIVVSLRAAIAGEPAIAIGNVVGSNIFNVLFILGASALVAPLVVSLRVIRQDVPIMVATSVLALLFAANGSLGRIEGAVLLLGAFGYTTVQVRAARRYRVLNAADHPAVRPLRLVADIGFIAAGLAMLVLGADWFVDGAKAIAALLGVSDLVIGLTIVAAGTSLPELATSVAAGVRGERDIAVGNIVGSNIFNLLFVLGGAALIAPTGMVVPPAVLTFDMPVMLAVAIACLPFFFTGNRVTRWEGAVFLGYYVAYTVYLVLDTTGHHALGIFTSIMLLFVLPITALTVVVILVRSLRTPGAPADRPGPGGGPGT